MEQEINIAYDDTLRMSAGKRFVHYLIDSIVFYIINSLIGFTFGVLYAEGMPGALLWYMRLGLMGQFLFTVFLMLLYYGILEFTTQRTVGKLVTGAVVVMEDGSKPPFKVIMLRTFCRAIPFEQFSFFGEGARGWHDTMTETYVVDGKRLKELKNLRSSLDEIGTIQY